MLDQVRIDKALLDDILRRYNLKLPKMKSQMRDEPANESVKFGSPNDADENAAFNGAELSESVLGRDWNLPDEDSTWSNL